MICEICSSIPHEPDEQLFALPTITSDCRPWGAGKSVSVCPMCGVMKRVTNPAEYFSNVYKDYVSYPEPAGRTKKILDFISDRMPIPKSVLDAGCGQGGGLKVLQDKYPDADVSGYEPTIGMSRPQGKFDLITLFHVLEHVEDLHEMLAYIKSSLNENGHVLIQVPYTLMWPFDLIIADHVWHFNKLSLAALFEKNGFEVIYGGNDIIRKELTLLASCHRITTSVISPERNIAIDWLLYYREFLDTITQPIAIYGTGPAAAWVGNILGDKVGYYIDDDASRHGLFNGKTVLSPQNEHLPIVAPFPEWQLEPIKKNNPHLRFL